MRPNALFLLSSLACLLAPARRLAMRLALVAFLEDPDSMRIYGARSLRVAPGD